MYVSKSNDGCLGIFLDDVYDNPEPPNLENFRFFKKGYYTLSLLPDREERTLYNCVRVEINNNSDPKIICSIIELMIDESNEPFSYSDLLSAIDKFRDLFKGTRLKLTDNELKGLWGELWLLKEFIFRSTSRDEMEHCLDSWKGSNVSKRDFRFQHSKVVFEVKTTEKKSREHQISSADQVNLMRGESQGFLVSIGVRREEGPASYTIKSLYEIICDRMADRLLQKKLIELLHERKWSPHQHQDISLIVTTGIPMRLFPFESVPTILPLKAGITEASWVVQLQPQDELNKSEQDRALDVSSILI